MTLKNSKEASFFHTRTCPLVKNTLYPLSSREEIDNKFFFKSGTYKILLIDTLLVDSN